MINISKNRINLLPNFIDEEQIITKPKTINDIIRNISYVGHIQISKGVNEIIAVALKYPEVSFLLAGKVNFQPNINYFPPNVKLLGEISKAEVMTLLSMSDIFLFPSHTEGFANVMLEAMAMGLPIIATDVGANRDMINDKGGVIIGKGNIDELENAVKILSNQTLRVSMSEWNLNRVRTTYTLEIVMKQLIDIYIDCLDIA